MSKSRSRPGRVCQPKPSPAARDSILGAVNALLGEPLTARFAVRLQDLARALAPALTHSTVWGYLTPTAAAGDLERVAPGRYVLHASRP